VLAVAGIGLSENQVSGPKMEQKVVPGPELWNWQCWKAGGLRTLESVLGLQ